MPPKMDQKLEERILKAATALWREQGDSGLTLRALARRVGTSTPTLYKRFKSRRALQVAMAERFKAEINAYCFGATSLEDVGKRYVEFAEKHPHEYELLWRTWTEIFHPEGPRPMRAWFLAQMAKRFGGDPESYSRTFYAIFLLAHGAATLLSISGDKIAHDEVRRNFQPISDVLLENAKLFRE